MAPMAEESRSFLSYLTQTFFSSPSQEAEDWMKDLEQRGIHIEEEHGHGHGMYVSHLAERMAVEPSKY